MQSLRDASRRLARQPTSSLVIAAVLAIGIGSTAAICSVVKAVTFQDPPYPHANRLVTAAIRSPQWSLAMLEEMERVDSLFEAMAGIHERGVTLGGGVTPAVIRIEGVSTDYFELLGVLPVAGAIWSAEQDVESPAGAVALISTRLLRQRFADPVDAIGKPLVIDGTAVRVAGVMPDGFQGLIGRTDAWVPLRFVRTLGVRDVTPARPWSRWFDVVARLPTGATLASAADQFEAEARRAMAAIPGSGSALGDKWQATLRPLKESLGAPEGRRAALLLLPSAGLLLLLACANAAALQLVGVARRRRELAVRVAVGGTPLQLARLAATEAALLTSGGAAAGVLLHVWIVDALRGITSAPAGSFGLRSAELLPAGAALDTASLAVLGFTTAIASIFVSVPPFIAAWRRGSAADLRTHPSAVAGFSRLGAGRIATGLVTAQIALAVVVLASAALMIVSVRNLWSQERGFAPENVLAIDLLPPALRYEGAAVKSLHSRLVERALSLPGVEGASVSNCVPGSGRCRRTNVSHVDGVALERGSVTVGVSFTTGEHFAVLRAPILRGRAFDARDSAGSPRTAIVNESAAARLWPGQDPIGRRFSLFFASGRDIEEREVVGVVGNIRYNTIESTPLPDVYVPGSQMAWTSTSLFVRTLPGGGPTPASIRQAIQAVDSGMPIVDVAPLEARLGRGFESQRMLSNTLTAFAVAALTLAVIGLYGLVANALANGRREIGVRLALGATRGRIARLVGSRVGWMVGGGVALGLAGAQASGPALAAFLFGVTPGDPAALAAITLLVIVTVAAAVALPVRHAMRIDPTEVLRD